MLSVSANQLLTKKDKKASFDIDETFDLEESEVTLRENAKGSISFKLRDSFILVNGKLDVPLNIVCDRCGKTFENTLNLEIDEAIEVNDSPEYEPDMEFSLEDLHEQVTTNQQIDISDFVRQYIILSIPTKNTCSDNCVNKHLEDLRNHNESKVDPRWEKLILYKDKYKGEN